MLILFYGFLEQDPLNKYSSQIRKKQTNKIKQQHEKARKSNRT